MHVVFRAKPVHDLRPRLAEVGRTENVRRAIVQERATHRHVHRAGVKGRRIDLRHAAEVRHVLRCHVGPAQAAVPRHMHQTVVRTGPDHIHILLAWPHREDHAVHLGAVHIARDRAARLLLRLRRMTREVAAQHLPRATAVQRAPQTLGRHEQHFRVDRREQDGERPLPPFLDVLRRLTRIEPGIRIHFARQARLLVELVDVAAVVRAGIENVRIEGVGRDVARLTATHLIRHRHAARRLLRVVRPAHVPLRRRAQRAVVLLRSAHVIGDVLRRDHVVPLRGREVLRAPLPTGVHRHRAATVVGAHEVRRIGRVNPQIVVVAVRAVADARERLARVGRTEQRGVLRVHNVRVLVVGEQMRVVECALTDIAVAVHQRPRGTSIVALEQAAVIVLDQRVHAVRVRRGQRHTDPAHQSRRQSLVARDLGPRFATVGALEQAGARTARRHLIFLAVRFPHGRVHHTRIVAVEGDIDRARLIVAE